MGQKPAVSVVMANYNGVKFLDSAVESVLNQSVRNLELIVADDASTDESLAVIDRWAKADPRVKRIALPCNSGPAAARNRALASAAGTWIAIMDSDDIMHPARLEYLIEAARGDGASIAADDLAIFYDDEARPSHTLLTGAYARDAFWVEIADYVALNAFYSKGPGLGYLKPVILTERLRAAGCRYDETLRIGEDYDFILRLLHRGLKYRVYPRQLYFYRKHRNSISHRLPSSSALALLDAEERFRRSLVEPDPRLLAAIEARRRSLETVLAFNTLIEALKARDLARAALLSIRRPRLIRLLNEPFRAAAARFREKLSAFGRGLTGQPHKGVPQ